MTAPTMGFGCVVPNPRLASSMARRMKGSFDSSLLIPFCVGQKGERSAIRTEIEPDKPKTPITNSYRGLRKTRRRQPEYRATFSIFSHPDCTVGSGFSPDLLCDCVARLAGSPDLVRNTAGLEFPSFPRIVFGIRRGHHALKIVVKLVVISR